MTMKQWFVALTSLFLLVGTSCKDELTLEDVGTDVYMTIMPSNPTLVYEVDTLKMECVLTSEGGKPVTGQVEWVSDDPTIARFLDGTNKLIAERAGIGKTVKVRAKLPNGKYALTTVTVGAAKAESLELLLVKINKKTEKVVDPKTKAEKEIEVYSGEYSFLGEQVYMSLGGSIEFVAKATPAAVYGAGDLIVEGIDPSLFTLEKMKLDPEVDKGKIAVTPAGAVWYSLKAMAQRGKAELTFKTPGKAGKEAKVVVDFGTKLEKIGFNTAMDIVQESAVLDIAQQTDVVILAEILPSLDEDLDVIRQSAVWSISDVQGGGGILTADPVVERTQSGIRLKATVQAAPRPGRFTVSCMLQGKTLAKSFTVVDKSKIPFDNIVFEGDGFDDLYAGEAKQLRIRILPMSSQAYIQDEIQISYSTPEIVSAEFNDGLYRVLGLKAGNTNMIVTVRGRTFSFPITVKPAPRLVAIDTSTENVIMLGDQVTWTADVQMEGGDNPIWNYLKWSIQGDGDKFVQFVGASTGKSVQIKATELTDKVTIVADYRAKQSIRELKVVPVQQSVALSPQSIDFKEAGITKGNGAVLVVLDTKKGETQPSIRLMLKPKSGVPTIQAKTYSTADYDIYVVWSLLNLRKAVTASSTVTISEAAGKYNVNANITMTVDGKPITVTGTINGLEKF